MYRSHVISIVEDTPSKVNWNEIIEGLEFHAKKSQVIPYTSTSNRISCDDRNVLYLYLYLCCCLVESCVQLFLRPHGLQPPRLLCPWDFLGKNTGVGCHFLLQGSFPPRDQIHIPYMRADSLQLSHQRNPLLYLYLCLIPPNMVTTSHTRLFHTKYG